MYGCVLHRIRLPSDQRGVLIRVRSVDYMRSLQETGRQDGCKRERLMYFTLQKYLPPVAYLLRMQNNP